MADRFPKDTTAVPDRGDPSWSALLRTRRIGYAAGAVTLTLLVAVAIAEMSGRVDAFGPGSAVVEESGGGYDLAVRYPTVTRGALATPFDIRIERAGGFDGPVEVALDWDWLEMWDENAFYPTPSSSWADEERLVMEFDPPDGEVLRIIYDARIQPSLQLGRDGSVAVLDDGATVVAVDFHTKVRP